MAVVTYPFPNPWPTPLGEESKLAPADLDTFGSVVNRMADGRVFTELSVLKNWTQSSTGTGTPSNRIVVYDPKSRRWITFGLTSGSPESYYTISGALWRPTGGSGLGAPSFTSFGGAAASPDGVILAGGVPASSTTAKIRESTNGGVSWVSRNIGASDTIAIGAIVYVRPLALWIAVLGAAISGINGIYTSTDRITWTRRSEACPFHFIIREADSAGRYGTMILGTTLQGLGQGAAYTFSSDGINWAYARFPENPSGLTCQGCWNYSHEVFALGTSAGIYTSRTGSEGSWRLVDTTFAASGTTTTSIASFGRAMLRGDGKVSMDGGVKWFPILETANTLFVRSEEGVAVYAGRNTVNDHRLSYRVGL